MDDERTAELLQECLQAYDAGLSPEECLSAFPRQRAQLEPLFRQALATRITFARSPRPEFVQRARDRLMFAAGREVRKAYDAKPDEAFVLSARQRLLNAAGASAQEALRSVPPPRLPFWVNARRRFLEAAAAPRPRKVTAPASFALRAGVAVAVVVAALGLASIGFFGDGGKPNSVSADVAELEEAWQRFELQRATGTISASQLSELTKRTNELLKKIEEEPAVQPIVVEKVSELVNRQQEVVNQVVTTQEATSGTVPPELKEAQQQVNQAELAVVRVKAAQVEPTASSAAATGPTPSATATTKPTETPVAAVTPTQAPATATPAVTVTPQPTPTREPLQPGQVLIALVPDDDTYGMSWKRIETTDISFLVPADWTVLGMNVSANGTATLESNQLVLQGGSSLLLHVNTTTGEAQAIVNGQALVLRGEGHDADVIPVSELVARAGEHATSLRYFLDSLELLTEPSAPTPSPSPSASPTPSATQQPRPPVSPTP